MLPLFDIFKMQNDGSLRWCEAVDTLEAAKVRVTELARSFQTQYVIFNQQTGEKIVIDACNLASASQTSKRDTTTKRPTYHICRVENEKLHWIEQVDDLRGAEARIKALKSAHPGDYIVLDYDPQESATRPPWVPLTCLMANYLISSAALGCISM